MKGVAYIELPPLGKVQSDRSGSALTWGAGVESRASLNETAGERVGRGMPSCSPGAGRSQENSADLSPGGSGVRHWMCWVRGGHLPGVRDWRDGGWPEKGMQRGCAKECRTG